MAKNPTRTKLVDTFVNVVTGLGMLGKDKRAGAGFAAAVLVDNEAADAYEGDWIARAVVDIPAGDMVREWRTFQTDKDKIGLLEAEEQRLGVRAKVKQALVWARLFGGAAIVFDDGTTDPLALMQPLRVSKGSLKMLHVLPRQRCEPGEIDWTFGGEFYNLPSFYTLNGGATGGTRLHPSRVVTFMGASKADPDRGSAAASRVYGDSVLLAGRDAILQATGSLAAIASLTEEAKTDVIKIQGLLAQSINKEFRDQLTERWQLAATLKSIANVTLIDGAEEWETKQVSFAGLSDVALLFLQTVAGAYGIPMTRFLSQSPAGMNSTGESDLQNYDQSIRAKQDNDLRPRLDRIDEVLIISTLGSRPEGIHSKFNPLRVPTPKEQQDLETAEAAAARSIADSGLVPIAALETAFQNRLIEGGRWPGLEKAIEDAKNGVLLPFEDPADDGNDIDPKTGQPFPDDDPRSPVAKAANENEPREIAVNGGKVSIKAGVKRPARDSMRDARERTLYVSRRLLNADEFIRWAKAQGFETTAPAEDLHVTVAFSRSAVDWMKIPADYWSSEADGSMIVRPGGARLVERLGDKGAVVLLFASEALEYRHRTIEGAGASWDFDGYQPHVTITYDAPDGLDLDKVEPFTGQLRFGPEIFEEIVEDWEKNLTET